MTPQWRRQLLQGCSDSYSLVKLSTCYFHRWKRSYKTDLRVDENRCIYLSHNGKIVIFVFLKHKICKSIIKIVADYLLVNYQSMNQLVVANQFHTHNLLQMYSLKHVTSRRCPADHSIQLPANSSCKWH